MRRKQQHLCKALIFTLLLGTLFHLPPAAADDYRVSPKILEIQDNVVRVIKDYSVDSRLGLIQMVAPVGWTEPVVSLDLELRGIVISGTLGLEFEDGTHLYPADYGFLIPKNTRVRIFNAGDSRLHLVEVLSPAFDPSLSTTFDSFE